MFSKEKLRSLTVEGTKRSPNSFSLTGYPRLSGFEKPPFLSFKNHHNVFQDIRQKIILTDREKYFQRSKNFQGEKSNHHVLLLLGSPPSSFQYNLLFVFLKFNIPIQEV